MASFGETLKRERELREISLRQVSEATKINIRYLEALEQNRFNILPGGLFNRGFIRAYATYIGVDGEAMVNSYLHEIATREGGGEAGGAGEPLLIHRPAELPPRRTDPRRTDLSGSVPPPAITLGPAPQKSAAAPGPIPQIAASPPRRGAAEAEAQGAAGAPAGGAAVDRRRFDPREGLRSAPFETQRSPSILSISEVEPPERKAPSSRAVTWILSLVAGAALLFLVLALLSGPASPPPDGPSVATGNTGSGAPDPRETSGLEALTATPEITTPDDGGPASGPSTRDRAAEPRAGGNPPSPRPEAAGRPQRPVSIASAGGTLPEPAGPEGADAAAPGGGGTAVEEEDEPASMRVEIETTAPTWVQLTCDAREMINRYMGEGESASMECLSRVRVSATDAGAVQLAVNDAPCLPLGEPGARAYGYTIRIDDYRKICRRSGRGTDGRP